MMFFDVVLLLLPFRPQGWRPPGGPQGPGHGPPGPSGYLKSVEMFQDDGSRIQDHKLVHVRMLVSLFLRNTGVMQFFRQVILIHFLEVCTF